MCREPTPHSRADGSGRSRRMPAASTRRTCATKAPHSKNPWRNHPIGQTSGASGPDLAPEGGQSAAAGALAEGADADGRGQRPRDGRQRRSVRLHRGELHAGIRFPAWALEGGQEKIAERLNDPPDMDQDQDRDASASGRARLSDLSFAVVASLPRGSVAEWLVDETGGREAEGFGRRPTRSWRRRAT